MKYLDLLIMFFPGGKSADKHEAPRCQWTMASFSLGARQAWRFRTGKETSAKTRQYAFREGDAGGGGNWGGADGVNYTHWFPGNKTAL